MNIDSTGKNIAAYCGFLALAIVVGALESIHIQYQATKTVDVMAVGDAVIAYILPSLVLMLGAMKLSSIGHEPLAEKASEHEDRLELDEPTPKPKRTRKPKPAPAVLTESVVQTPRARPRPAVAPEATS